MPYSSPRSSMPSKTPRKTTPASVRKSATESGITVISLLSDSEEETAEDQRGQSTSSKRQMSIPHRGRELADLDQSIPRKRAKVDKGLFVTGDSSPSQPSSTNDGQQVSHHDDKPSPSKRVASQTISNPRSTQSKTAPATDAVTTPTSIDAIVPYRLHELKQDTVYSTRALLQRARLAAPKKRQSNSNVAADVFAALTPVAVPGPYTKEKAAKGKLLLQTESWSAPNIRSTRRALKVNVEEHNLKEKKAMPRYCHVVRLQESMLIPNITNLNVWPYFHDEFQPDAEHFNENYTVDVDGRPEKLRRLQTAQWLFEATEQALSDAKLSWADIAGLLYAEDEDLKSHGIVLDALFDEEAPWDSNRWSKLHKVVGSTASLSQAYDFCMAFQDATAMSIWHLLRRSHLVKNYFGNPEDLVTDIADRECRICFRFDCPMHGEIQQNLDQEPTHDPASSSDEEYGKADARDIVNPPRANFRKHVAFKTSKTDDGPVPSTRQARTFWEYKNFTLPDSMAPFYPCDHPGQTCEQASCTCFKASVPCEKFCTCPSTCLRKFQGCLCDAANPRRSGEYVCFKDDRCACYQMGRECDPDLCGKCGVCAAIDIGIPDSELQGRCHNASIQRGLPKHTLLGDSAVHELGLYACEDIHPHDFIGEYKGEIITKDEANRRGAIYEHQKLSYLFTLNNAQEVDSTYCGNKIRFINHNSQALRNIYAVIMLVNTVHRIALFAEKHIRPGQELFFDYGPQFPHEQLGGKKVRKAAPVVRNRHMLTEFANPQETRQKIKMSGKAAHKKGVAKVIMKSKSQNIDKKVRSESRSAQRTDAGSRLAQYNVADDSEDDDGAAESDSDSSYESD